MKYLSKVLCKYASISYGLKIRTRTRTKIQIRRGRGDISWYHMNLTSKTFKKRVVTSLSYCVCWSGRKLNIAITLVSWLGLHFLSNAIPQTLINEVLAATVPLKNYLPEHFQKKMKKI